MMSCHICYIYGTWSSKEVVRGERFKVIWGQATKGGPIFMGELTTPDTM